MTKIRKMMSNLTAVGVLVIALILDRVFTLSYPMVGILSAILLYDLLARREAIISKAFDVQKDHVVAAVNARLDRLAEGDESIAKILGAIVSRLSGKG